MPHMLLPRAASAPAVGLVACLLGGCTTVPTISVLARHKESPRFVVGHAAKRVPLDGFLKNLRSPRPGQQYFSVAVQGSKVGTSQPAVWVDGLKIDGDRIEGRVVPGRGRSSKIVKFAAGDVRDWMIVEGGRVIGGYTLRD